MMMMMMMMSGFVERVIVLKRAVDQPTRSAFRCRANVGGERVAVRRAVGKLFKMSRPATTKLLIPIAWSFSLVRVVTLCERIEDVSYRR